MNRIALTIAGIATLAWLAYMGAQLLPQALVRRRAARAAEREARRELIRRNPTDYVRAALAGGAEEQTRVNQTAEASRVGVQAATDHETKLLAGFDGGVEPNRPKVIVTLMLATLWLVSIVGQALLDFPIILAVSGGNTFFAVLGTMLVIAVPMICGLALAEVFKRRRRGMGRIPSSLAVTGILAAFMFVVALLSTLAPIRAEVEYQDQIRTVEQQIAQFTEDGDDTAVAFAEQNLEELRAQQARSADFNEVLVPLSFGAEFATGFALPLTIMLYQLMRARAAKRTAAAAQRKADDAVEAHRVRVYGALAADFQDAGVSQVELQRAFEQLAAENGGTGGRGALAALPAGAATADATPPVEEPPSSTPSPGGPAHPVPGTPENSAEEPTRRAEPPGADPDPEVDEPDPSFDLS